MKGVDAQLAHETEGNLLLTMLPNPRAQHLHKQELCALSDPCFHVSQKEYQFPSWVLLIMARRNDGKTGEQGQRHKKKGRR